MNIQTDTCSSLVYNIFALDCGVCPNSTNSLSVTCTNITTTGPTCSFEVESVICDHLISNRSEPLTTSLKGIQQLLSIGPIEA